MSTTRKLIPVCAAAVAVVLVPPAAGHVADGTVLSGKAARTAGEVSAYWTPKRMRNAKPVDLVVPAEDSPPDPVPVPVPSAGTSSTAVELPDTTSFPNRVHGKVFFTKASGGNFVCSGTAVLASNDSTVITAGHCVYDGTGFDTNFAFVPGYRNGASPFGVWAASLLGSTPQWVQAGNFKYDVGAAVMARNSSGQELEDVIGARGILFNQPVSGSVRAYGYPAANPFDGSKLWACDASLGLTDLNPGLPSGGPAPMGILCDMTGGSSGGGWVVTDASGNGSVISVNSYKYLSQPNLMYGPQLTSTAQGLYTSLESVPPGTPLSPAAGTQQQPSSQPAQPAAAPAKRKCRKKKRRGKKKHRGKKKKHCKKIKRKKVKRKKIKR